MKKNYSARSGWPSKRSKRQNDFHTYLAGLSDDEELKSVLLNSPARRPRRDGLISLYERMKEEIEEQPAEEPS